MGPREVAAHLKAIAAYIEREAAPRRDLVKNGISGVLTAMSPYATRSAGSLEHFMAPEIKGALGGMDSLIARVQKVIGTLNPQDENHSYLTGIKKDLEKTREDFSMQLEDFENVDF